MKKKKKGGFLGMLLVTLAASVLGSDKAFIINLHKYKSTRTLAQLCMSMLKM